MDIAGSASSGASGDALEKFREKIKKAEEMNRELDKLSTERYEKLLREAEQIAGALGVPVAEVLALLLQGMPALVLDQKLQELVARYHPDRASGSEISPGEMKSGASEHAATEHGAATDGNNGGAPQKLIA